jgi:PAS domain S-box-containing protein
LALLLINIAGELEVVNCTFLDKLGYSKEEVIGKRYTEFLHPDDIHKSQNVEEENVKRGTFAKGLGYFENRYRTKDGRYLTFRWKEGSAIYHNDFYLCYAEIKEDA